MDHSLPERPSIEPSHLLPYAELDDAVHRRIVELSKRGDELIESDRVADSLAAYDEAVALLPEPKAQWSAWTWLQAARGDVFFFQGDWQSCRNAFGMALAGPEGPGNPFIHLRLGQCALELGDESRAKDELMRAYMGDGTRTFEGEDLKYLEFLKRFARID